MRKQKIQQHHKIQQSHRPGSGSSSFSLSRGNAGRRASGNLRNTLYMMRTAFLRRYGRVDVIWHQQYISSSFCRCTIVHAQSDFLDCFLRVSPGFSESLICLWCVPFQQLLSYISIIYYITTCKWTTASTASSSAEMNIHTKCCNM